MPQQTKQESSIEIAMKVLGVIVHLYFLSLIYFPFAYTKLQLNLRKCASLLIPTENCTYTLLDIYEGKENIPGLAEELEEKVGFSVTKVWEERCNVTICGWLDGLFGRRCRELAAGENRLAEQGKNYLIDSTYCECERGNPFCKGEVNGCLQRPMPNLKVCGSLYFEENCRDCENAGISLVFKQWYRLSAMFVDKLRSFRVRQGCQLWARNSSRNMDNMIIQSFSKSESNWRMYPANDGYSTVFNCNCDCSVTSDRLNEDGPTPVGCSTKSKIFEFNECNPADYTETGATTPTANPNKIQDVTWKLIPESIPTTPTQSEVSSIRQQASFQTSPKFQETTLNQHGDMGSTVSPNISDTSSNSTSLVVNNSVIVRNTTETDTSEGSSLPIVIGIEGVILLSLGVYFAYLRCRKVRSAPGADSSTGDTAQETVVWRRSSQIGLVNSTPVIRKAVTSPWRSFPYLKCEGELDQGAFGTVYKATDTLDIYHPKGYAVKSIDINKTLNSCPRTDVKSMFSTLVNEVRIMSKLSSDNVVRYNGCWAESESANKSLMQMDEPSLKEYIDHLLNTSVPGSSQLEPEVRSFLFLKLEFCETNLDKWIKQYRENNSDEEVTNVILQIATGLKYIHSKGVVHRDLKPANILGKVCSDNVIMWKIADFGLSVRVNPDGTYNGQAGTRIYRSPEMQEGLHYTTKTDIYSLGLCALELLQVYGRKFEKVSVFDELIELGDEQREELVEGMVGRWNGNFKKVIIQMLHKDPEQRWSSVGVCDYLNCLNRLQTRIII